MAQSKFSLNLCGIGLPITLSKTTNPEVYHFNRGYNGKPVKNVNVQPTKESGGAVASVKDISRVVPFGELQQLYCVNTETEQYIVVDAKDLKKRLYPKSETMFVYAFTDLSSFSFDQFNGDHHFVLLQKVKGTKDVPEDQRAVYTSIHRILSKTKQSIVVSYVSNNTERFGVIYVAGNLLKLSGLYPSNFQRDAPTDILTNVPNGTVETLQEIFASMYKKTIQPGAYADRSAEKIKKAIADIVAGKGATETPKEPEPEPTGIMAQLLRISKKESAVTPSGPVAVVVPEKTAIPPPLSPKPANQTIIV